MFAFGGEEDDSASFVGRVGGAGQKAFGFQLADKDGGGGFVPVDSFCKLSHGHFFVYTQLKKNVSVRGSKFGKAAFAQLLG